MKTITLIIVALVGGLLSTGCTSTSDPTAAGGGYPLLPVNLATVQPPAVLVLDTIITANGPGAWNQEAPWDEYVLTVSNQGSEPLIITAAALADGAGTSRAPGESMKALERQSTALEQEWREAGAAFSRDTVPAVETAGGVRLIGTTGGVAGAGVGFAAATAMMPLPGVYTRRIVSLSPRYYADEFKQRRLVLPLTLGPGEVRAGSLFFPMVPNPRALTVRWANSVASGELMLPLASVHGLHAAAAIPPAAVR